jgi:hypothetical protein
MVSIIALFMPLSPRQVFAAPENLPWSETWGERTYDDYAYGVAVGSDGVYVAGYTQSHGAGILDAFSVEVRWQW